MMGRHLLAISYNESRAIDSWRSLACLVVVCSHIYEFVTLDLNNYWNELISYSAVVLFFAISGFVNTHSFYSKASIREFFHARAVRILPLFWLSLSFGIVLAVAFGLFQWRYLWSVFALSPVFGTVPTNAPLWSLAYEIWLYLALPLLLVPLPLFVKAISVFVIFFLFALFDHLPLLLAFLVGVLLAGAGCRWPLPLWFFPRLGRSSYEIYIFHYPVFFVIGGLLWQLL